MRIYKLACLLAVTALSAALVAGCGGDDKEAYAEDVQAVLDPLGTQLTELGSELSAATSPDELVDGLDQVESDINSSIDELEAISPPADVEDVHQDLISALQSFNDSIATVRDAAESGDLAAVQEAALELSQAALDLQSKMTDVTERAAEAGVPVEGS